MYNYGCLTGTEITKKIILSMELVNIRSRIKLARSYYYILFTVLIHFTVTFILLYLILLFS